MNITGLFKGKKKKLLLAVVFGLLIGLVIIPAISAQKDVALSAGFKSDGEKVGTDLFQAFVNPSGTPVDAIWVEMTWIFEGTDVDWATFFVDGSYEIRLWHINSPTPNMLKSHSFQHTGEIYASAPHNNEAMDYDLGDYGLDLENQIFTNPADPTYWSLTFYGEFTATVDDIWGNALDPIEWSGETSPLKVYWLTGAWSGSGTVDAGTFSP